MSMLIDAYRFGGGAGAPLYDLIMADLAAAGSGYFFRHAEASGSVMENEVGADGTYVGNVVLGQPSLYSGGGTCVRIPQVSLNGVGNISTNLPALTQLSIVQVVNFTSLSAGTTRALFCVDNGASIRRWQWRVVGAQLDWVKIAGGVVTKSFGTGMVAGSSYLLGVEIKDSGTPGTSDIVFYVNGTAVYTSTIATVDYGSIAAIVEIGSNTGAGGANANAYFSESALIPAPIGSARWLEYAEAAGFV